MSFVVGQVCKPAMVATGSFSGFFQSRQINGSPPSLTESGRQRRCSAVAAARPLPAGLSFLAQGDLDSWAQLLMRCGMPGLLGMPT
jgi:hypothetical protein